jgi:hypothetical protein
MYVQICAQRDDHGAHTHTAETPKTACLGRWLRQRGYMSADHASFCHKCIFWITLSRYDCLHAIFLAQTSSYSEKTFKISLMKCPTELTCRGTYIPAAAAASVCLFCSRVCSWKNLRITLRRHTLQALAQTSALPAASATHFTGTTNISVWRAYKVHWYIRSIYTTASVQ